MEKIYELPTINTKAKQDIQHYKKVEKLTNGKNSIIIDPQYYHNIKSLKVLSADLESNLIS